MISVIISKYHPTLIDILKLNIETTIGVAHEIIVIENGKGQMGLCEVYNKAAQIAKYEILCYSHEDIEILSNGWGNTIVELFNENKNLGLLGLAGTGFKSNSPSGWWHPKADPKTMFSNYIQGNKVNDDSLIQCSNPSNKRLSPVVCVDGFWFCTRRHCALELKFDESTFTGFHCYDIDFSLSVFKRYEVAVTFDITIKHFSQGSGIRDWVKDTLKLYKKWENSLPFDVMPLDEKNRQKEEIKAFHYFLHEMLENNYSTRDVYHQLWTLKAKSRLGLAGFTRVNINIGWEAFKRMVKRLLNFRPSPT